MFGFNELTVCISLVAFIFAGLIVMIIQEIAAWFEDFTGDKS